MSIGSFVPRNGRIRPHDALFQLCHGEGLLPAFWAELFNKKCEVLGVFSDAYIPLSLIVIRSVIGEVILDVAQFHHPFCHLHHLIVI